jgi:hypothetical protein
MPFFYPLLGVIDYDAEVTWFGVIAYGTEVTDSDGNGSDSDRILQISIRNHIRDCNQYSPATIPAGRNLYPCPCPSDFGRVSDIHRI